MKDYSDKNWLRPTPSMFKRLLQFIGDMIMVAIFLGLLAWSINRNDARAAPMKMVLLEPSSQAATLDECQRTHPKLGRPHQVVSFQNGSGTNWHHRTCYYA